MSREAFEQWIINNSFSIQHANGDTDAVVSTEDVQDYFQACEQHYAGRIAELEAELRNLRMAFSQNMLLAYRGKVTELETKLQSMAALVAKKDEALRFYADGEHWDKIAGEVYLNDKGEMAQEAITIKADSVEVVEAINLSDEEWNKYKSTGEGTKLYTIKVKP